MLLVFLLQNGVHGSQDTASSWDPKNDVFEQEVLAFLLVRVVEVVEMRQEGKEEEEEEEEEEKLDIDLEVVNLHRCHHHHCHHHWLCSISKMWESWFVLAN